MATHPVRLSIDDLPTHIATLKAELQDGHTVELLSGDQVVGEVRARSAMRKEQVSPIDEPISTRPDVMAELKRMWGEQPLNVDTTTWVREDRDGYDGVR